MSSETLTFTVDKSTRSIPITVSPAGGTLKVAVNAADITTLTGQPGGNVADWHQYSNTTPPGLDPDGLHYWGSYRWNVPMGGLPAIELTAPPLPGIGKYSEACVSVRPSRVNMPAPADLGPYHGGSIYIPAGGLNILGGGASHWVNLGEFNAFGHGSATNPIPQAPWTLDLYPDRLELTGLCGTYTKATGHYQYSGAQTLVHVIPTGVFAANEGKWISYIIRFVWACDGTGEVETWYRVRGGQWQQAVAGTQYQGKPTYVWAADISPPDLTLARNQLFQPAQAYMFGSAVGTQPTVLYVGGPLVGTTFQVVAAALP